MLHHRLPLAQVRVNQPVNQLGHLALNPLGTSHNLLLELPLNGLLIGIENTRAG
jgi:hypothetical protein